MKMCPSSRQRRQLLRRPVSKLSAKKTRMTTGYALACLRVLSSVPEKVTDSSPRKFVQLQGRAAVWAASDPAFPSDFSSPPAERRTKTSHWSRPTPQTAAARSDLRESGSESWSSRSKVRLTLVAV